MSGSSRSRPALNAGFLRSQLWLVPVVSLVGASLLAILTTWLDRALLRASVFEELFSRNPDAIRTALSVVASSILTFTALVFTMTMVVVQQASNQLSPRVVRNFLEDRMSQITLGVFVGTFAYSLLVLRDVRSPLEGDAFVPGVSVALVFVAVFASVAMFVSYLSHITDSLQVSTVVQRISRETEKAIERLYSSGPSKSIGLPSKAEGQAVTWDGDSGVLRHVDRNALADLAREADVVVRVCMSIGDFVPTGTDVLWLEGTLSDSDRGAALSTLDIGLRRDVRHDVAFGFRQLLDIAERALSPGVNDPTTAVQVIDRIHDLLRRLANLDLSTAVVIERNGRIRVIVPGLTWPGYVAMASEELRHYGSSSIQVARRMRAMFDDLEGFVSADRHKAILHHRDLLNDAIAQHFGDELDRGPVG